MFTFNYSYDYSQTWVNDHLRITTTCLQQPQFWGPNFNFHNIKLPLNNDHLSTTATNFGSQGWSLNTSLTVYTITIDGTSKKWCTSTRNHCIASPFKSGLFTEQLNVAAHHDRSYKLSWVATVVFSVRLLHAVAFSKKSPWFESIKVITLKTQLHAVNAH